MRDLSVGCLNINKLPFSDQIKLSATIKHLLTQLNTDITIVQELSCPTSGWQTMVQQFFVTNWVGTIISKRNEEKMKAVAEVCGYWLEKTVALMSHSAK